MGKREDLVDLMGDPELLFADGFDEAILGADDQTGRVVYSVPKMIEIVLEYFETYEEALEYLNYNTFSAHVGERTPIYCWLLEKEIG